MGFGSDNHSSRGVLPAIKRCVFFALVLCVAGCGLRTMTHPDNYRVQHGDTLYSIATQYGLNWREVARWNHIGPPYTIAVGQVLSLERYPTIPYPETSSQTSKNAAAKQSAPSQTPRKHRPVRKKTAKRAPPRKPRPKIINDGGKHWHWPATGKVLRTYDEAQPRQGIDIGGKLGSPVVAAQAGRVVYSGSGLKGYGKLIIIKHDERFLTAYSFNRRLLVDQGEHVKAGQKIAEMGKGPHNEDMLHFELRQDGDPVDPLRVLPSR